MKNLCHRNDVVVFSDYNKGVLGGIQDLINICTKNKKRLPIPLTELNEGNLEDAMKSDLDKFAKFFHGMLQEGIYVAPSQFEAGFISAAHTEEDVAKTAAAATKVLKAL